MQPHNFCSSLNVHGHFIFQQDACETKKETNQRSIPSYRGPSSLMFSALFFCTAEFPPLPTKGLPIDNNRPLSPSVHLPPIVTTLSLRVSSVCFRISVRIEAAVLMNDQSGGWRSIGIDLSWPDEIGGVLARSVRGLVCDVLTLQVRIVLFYLRCQSVVGCKRQ
jgi:hypothetical protein